MNLGVWLVRAALEHPEEPAVYRGETPVLTYRELLERSATVAARLREEFSVQPADRVGIIAGNCVEYLELLHGTWLLGAAAVPINAKLHPSESAWILGNAEAAVAFVEKKYLSAVTEAVKDAAGKTVCIRADTFADERSPVEAGELAVWDSELSDLAWLFYTSGTTGRPKGVMLTNQNLIAMSAGVESDVTPISADTTVIYAAPMSHGAGLYSMAHIQSGARHVVPSSGRFEADEVLDLCKAFGHCTVFLAPTMLGRLVTEAEERGDEAPGLDTVVYGGGPMYLADLDHALKALGPRLVQVFAQGESPMTGTVLKKAHHADTRNERYRARLASVGRPHSLSQVRIVDEKLQPVAPGVVGEIELRGLTVMAGYWKNPAATDEAMDGKWLRTGDVGFMSEDGFLTLRDRSKDMIISGGTNIYPREVEEVLLEHPAVAEAAVVGRPDREWGELVTACIVVRGQVSDAELDALCLGRIARFKRPKDYVRLDALPKNNYGKVVKPELRALLASHFSSAEPTQT